MAHTATKSEKQSKLEQNVASLTMCMFEVDLPTCAFSRAFASIVSVDVSAEEPLAHGAAGGGSSPFGCLRQHNPKSARTMFPLEMKTFAIIGTSQS